MKELFVRTISGLFLIGLVLLAVFFLSAPFFYAVLSIIILAGAYELFNLLDVRKWKLLGIFNTLLLLLFLYFEQFAEGIFALILLTAVVTVLFTRKEDLFDFKFEIGACVAVPFLLGFTLYHLFLIWEVSRAFLIMLVWIISVADTGAYLVGRHLGRRKIFPTASPRKTWEGFWAALLTGTLAGFAWWKFFELKMSLEAVLFLSLFSTLAAQLSDPFESLFKRAKGVKDSSALIPEHGGILDRIDSYILASGVFFHLLRLLK